MHSRTRKPTASPSVPQPTPSRPTPDPLLDLLHRAVDQADESIIITNNRAEIVYVNEGFTRASGYSREEVLGQNPRLLKGEGQPEGFYEDLWKQLSNGEPWSGTFVNRRKDGTAYTEEAVISPVRDSGGAIAHFIAVKRDVTRERQLEAQLRHAQKLESVGQLAGGIAHDFNNLLTVILGNITHLEATLPSDSAARHEVEQIARAAQRAAELTRQLLSFSRRQSLDPRPSDLGQIASNLQKILVRLLPENIQLEVVPCGIPLPVRVDTSLIEQVVLNLALNARDAMPRGGRLTLRLGRGQPQTRTGFFYSTPLPENAGPLAYLELEDTGHGVPEDLRERLFDPYFTTKAVGKGSGLGLSTALGIVQQHQGLLGFRSTWGKGSTFVVWLPVMAGAHDTLPPATPPPAHGGNETLLFVEDEPLVRQIASRILGGLGYTVLPAASAAEALRIARDSSIPLDLLMTDVVMPDMSGLELAESILLLRPGLPVLYCSGYPREELSSRGLTSNQIHLLQKPFNRPQLAAAIREALGHPA